MTDKREAWLFTLGQSRTHRHGSSRAVLCWLSIKLKDGGGV